MTTDNQKLRIPFPGMRPYRQDENSIFPGREREIAEIIKKLLDNRFVAVIGAEGSGKTSVMLCGVIPSLARESGKWRVMTLSPGGDPVGSLAGAIAVLAGERNLNAGKIITVTDTLKNNPGSFSGITEDILEKDERLLVVVDQFEEIFRFSREDTGQNPVKNSEIFVSLLLNSIIRENGRVYLAVVISSPWISDCTRFPNFAEAVIINRSSVIIPALPKESLENVLLQPLSFAGIKAEPELEHRIISEAAGYSGQLPVLQNTLRHTLLNWQKNGDFSKPLSLTDFEESGTFSGSVEKHAEEIFSDLDRNEKYLCEKIFRVLTVKGPGGEYQRKPSSSRYIMEVAGCSREKLAEVVKKLSDDEANLINCTGDIIADPDSVLDIRYNELLLYWRRLRSWADEEDNSVRTYKQLASLASLYHQGKRGLMIQPELQRFSDWAVKEKPVLQWAVTYDPAFERAMLYLRTSEKHYKEEEEKQEKIKKRRLRRRKYFGLGVFAGFFIILSILGIYITGKIRSDKALREAEILQDKSDSVSLVLLKDFLIADSLAARAKMNEQHALKQKETEFSLRMQAMARAEREKILRKNTEALADSVRFALNESRQNELNALRLKQEESGKRMLSISKAMALKSLQLNGLRELQTLLAYQAWIFNNRFGGSKKDPDIYMGLYNVAKQYGSINYKVFKGHEGAIRSVAFVPGKNQFFTSGEDGKVLKWDMDNNGQNIQVVYSGSGIAEVLSVSPEADWLACGMDDAVIRMIPVKDPSAIRYELRGHTGKIKSLVFSYDGKTLYSAALDGKLLKWDLAARTSGEIGTGNLKIISVDISSGNTYLAGLSDDGRALIWNEAGKRETMRIESPGKAIRSIRFSPGENILAVGYDNGMIELWDVASGNRIDELQAHEAEVSLIRFNKLMAQMATSSSDGSLKIWDLSDLKALPLEFRDNDDMVVAIDFSPDGQIIISGTAGSSTNLVGRPAHASLLAMNVCGLLSRNFTEEEWSNYVGKDISYEKTCDEKEFGIKVKVIR